jgi:hypothetical protein
MPNSTDNPDRLLTRVELESAIPLTRASEITSLSPETIKRRYPELVLKLSPRRSGMKLRSALAIASGQTAKTTPAA